MKTNYQTNVLMAQTSVVKLIEARHEMIISLIKKLGASHSTSSMVDNMCAQGMSWDKVIKNVDKESAKLSRNEEKNYRRKVRNINAAFKIRKGELRMEQQEKMDRIVGRARRA